MSQNVRYEGDVEASRREWFLAGTERALIVPERGSAASQTPGIAAPVDGSVYALDRTSRRPTSACYCARAAWPARNGG